jgi:hypothetical protein
VKGHSPMGAVELARRHVCTHRGAPRSLAVFFISCRSILLVAVLVHTVVGLLQQILELRPRRAGRTSEQSERGGSSGAQGSTDSRPY